MKPSSRLPAHIRKHSAAVAFRALLLATVMAAVGCSHDPGPGLLRQLEVHLGRVHREILPNGLTALFMEDHTAPVVAIQVWVRNGSIYEDEYLGAGISHAIEHMIFKGTPTRPPGAIVREISDQGGHINAYTSLDRTVFHCVMPTAAWALGLEILADAVKNARFPEEEWQKERQVILREMAMNQDDPGWVLSRLLWSAAFRVHPYRYPVIGYEAPFRTLQAQDLRTFFQRRYRPDNTLVVLAGDFRLTDAVHRVSSAFADFRRRCISPPCVPEEPAQAAPRRLTRTGSYRLGRLALGFHTVPFSHPDAPVLDVLAEVASRGRSSRLVRRLREELGLVHEISAWSYTGTHPGLFGIEAVFDPTNAGAVAAALQREIADWQQHGFSEEEVRRARRALMVDELSRFQDVEGAAAAVAAGEFYAGDPAYSLTYLRKVRQTTPAVLRRAARCYLTRENSTMVELLPGPPATTAGAAQAVPTDLSGSLRKITLPNGARLILREDHRLPFVHICVAFRGGLLSETTANAGLTYLMSQMLTRGTRQHSAAEIARQLDNMAATLEPFSGANSFGLRGRCLRSELSRFAALLAECLAEPSFPAEELKKARNQQLAALAEQRERPFFTALLSLRRLMFGTHPYSRDPLGEPDTVRKITRADIVRHYRALVRAGNCVAAFFGDVYPARDLPVLKSRLERLPSGTVSLPPRPPAFASLPARAKQRFPGRQAIVLLGYPSVTVTDRLADAVVVIQESLNGMASDLFREIREKRGLVYYAGAMLHMGLDPGFIALYAGTTEQNAGTALSLLNTQAEKLAQSGLDPEAVQRAKRRLLSDFHLRLQHNGDLALHCALDELYGLGCEHTFRFAERLAAVDTDLVKEAAQALFTTDERAVSLVLPAVKRPGKSAAPSAVREEEL